MFRGVGFDGLGVEEGEGFDGLELLDVDGGLEDRILDIVCGSITTYM